MRVTIEINMENAAFNDAPFVELQRILSFVPSMVGRLDEDAKITGHNNLLDINGNKVGYVRVEK